MRLATVAVLASLIAFTVFSQQSPVGETLEIRLIEVDAVVTDRAGNPVHGLTANDFELFENGRKQAITNFAEYRETVEATGAVPAAPAAPRAAAAAQPAVSVPEPRTIVLFIDAVPVHGPERTKLFESLRSLIGRTMREGDRAQVVTWNDMAGVSAETPLTTDRGAIERAVAQVENRANVAGTGPTTEEYAQFFAANAAEDGGGSGQGAVETSERFSAERELALMRRKTAIMQRIVSALPPSSGKSVFVYVSEVFPAVAGKRANTPRRSTGLMGPSELALRSGYSTRAMLDNVIAAANANGVSFYALRAQRPVTAPIDIQTLAQDQQVVANPAGGLEAITDQVVLQNEVEALALVADQTGGALGIGPQQVNELVDRVVRDVSSYYTLAYRARTDGSDRERRIEVRAKNPNHVVRSRTAIVEKSDRTRARDLVLARLFERGPAGDLTFGVTTGAPVPVSKSRVHIPVELSIPAEQLQFTQEGNELAAKFTVLSVSGLTLHGVGNITEQSKRITAPLGSTPAGAIRFTFQLLHDRKPASVAIAVFDEKSGLAGTRRLSLGATEAVVTTEAAVSTDAWKAALATAAQERKPILVFERPERCKECNAFEKNALTHPVIERRLHSIVFLTQPGREPRLVLFDRAGNERVKWTGVPREPALFGAILDNIMSIAPNLERAVTLAEEGPHEGELEIAIALSRLGRHDDARAAVERAIAHGTPKTRQLGLVARAMLQVANGKADEALKTLDRVIAEATSPDIAATGWIGIATVHRGQGATAEAIKAYNTAISVAGAQSEVGIAAAAALKPLQSATATGAVRLVPMEQKIVTGRRTIKTSVATADVAKVVFTIDGAEQITVDRPPFSTTIDFGRIPQTKTIRVAAHDASGQEIGRDELTVNHAGELFWLRMTEPREGPAAGKVRVTTTMRTPAGRAVERVVLSWNDTERAVITAAPWQAVIDVPQGEIGVLRAVAELDDGRTTEDAVLLNARGVVEHADVQLVELPITIRDGDKPAEVTAGQLSIREGKTRRAVESLVSGAEAPLTVGMVIDASGSMLGSILNVQEAAIRFLETTLGASDRAFLVTFDNTTRLVQAPTADRAALRDRIMAIKPGGRTALHDAMILGLMQFEGVKGRRALVVFSDGGDSSSRYGLGDVEALARRSNIPVYFIMAAPNMRAGGLASPAGGPLAPPRPVSALPAVGTSMTMQRSMTLTRVINATGGDAYLLRSLDDLPQVYAQIEEALRAQMLAVIRTDAGRSENDWRTIDVDVEGRRLQVRAPAGYYAPW